MLIKNPKKKERKKKKERILQNIRKENSKIEMRRRSNSKVPKYLIAGPWFHGQ